jgi:hypothetical protein
LLTRHANFAVPLAALVIVVTVGAGISLQHHTRASGDPVTTALLARKDLIYGSEIGAWRTSGKPAVDTTTSIPASVQAAKVPLIRFSQYDSFSGVTNPNGTTGTESRTTFDSAIDGIRNNLKAEPLIKLLPIAPDQMGNPLAPTPDGTVFCPPATGTATQNLGIYQDLVQQAGSRVRFYESSNEMEYTCAGKWGFPSAGSVGVSKRLGEHYAQNMPALKKYARTLGFEIISIGYIGVSGGTGWGDSIASPNTRSMTEFMTAAHDAYVANGNDPDYIPDVVSIHAYPHSPDFGFSYNSSTGTVTSAGNTTDQIIQYFDNWSTANRSVINSIWGPTLGPNIKLAVSEWNAGNSVWPGFTATSGDNVSYFYTQWLTMLRRNNFYLADQFAIASNDSSNHDMIREDGFLRQQYYAFKDVATADPLLASPSPSPKVGDINNDNAVNIFDLSILLSKWGTSTSSCDLNSDGTVNVFDLSVLLSHWGT